eukprot:6318215-Amphidinium_carterae.1
MGEASRERERGYVHSSPMKNARSCCNDLRHSQSTADEKLSTCTEAEARKRGQHVIEVLNYFIAANLL